MTVTYSLNVANTRLNGFAKLLIRWRGSIYKLLYREMIIFCILYYSLSLLYRYLLNPDQRRVFEKVALYCEAFSKLIPLSFILGFYVSIVVSRWWNQYCAIPWPDNLLMMVAGIVQGDDERGRIIRRTFARYLLSLQAVTFQAISISVKRRFPTEDHLVEAGIMTKEEKMAYDEVPGTYGKWWVPATWFTTLAIRSRKEGRIKDDILLKLILEELYKFRGGCGDLFAFDWISIPLVYTQAVTIAVYTYFAAVIMARQYLDPAQGYSGHEVDLYIPVFTLLEFFFFMGWLKVAEQLINPFGEDDDDFELNYILDRNLVVSMFVVDSMHNKLPKLVRDSYWDEARPSLPYTRSSGRLRSQPYLGSAMNLDINPEDSEFMPPSLETIMEDDINEPHHFSRTVGGTGSGPGSPIAELLNLDFPSHYDPSLFTGSRPQSSVSQSALNLLPDFLGSRIANMIIGQSNENVGISANNLKASKDKLSIAGSGIRGGQSLLGPFSLKSPRRRTRKISVPSNLKPSVSSSLITKTSVEDFSRKNGASASPQSGRRGTGRFKDQHFDERRSLVIDLNDETLSQRNLDTPQLYSQTHLSSSPLSRLRSGSIDETGLGHSYPPSRADDKHGYIGSGAGGVSGTGNLPGGPNNNNREDAATSTLICHSSSYINNLCDSTITLGGYRGSPSIQSGDTFGSSYSALGPYPPSSQISDVSDYEETVRSTATLHMSGQLGPDNTSQTCGQSENKSAESLGSPGQLDRSSSHESLGPCESNQSTVTSITQLLGKGNKDGQ